MTTATLSGAPVLETERMTLRAPRASDAEAFAAFFTSERAAFVGGGPELDSGRAWRNFATHVGHWALRGCGLFMMERRSDAAIVGAVGPWFPADWPEREIGWSVWPPEAEGEGYAREGAQAVLRHVFRDLGWDTAVSYVDRTNRRSIALAERLGAVRDDAAATPRDEACLVYRHPRPEEAR